MAVLGVVSGWFRSGVAAVALSVVASVLLASPSEVHAQSASTLVSNIGQPTSAIESTVSSTRSVYQVFTTGGNTVGYNGWVLDSIVLDIHPLESATTEGPVVEVFRHKNLDSSEDWGLDPPLFTLTNPALSASTSGPQTFAAPEGAMLEASTTYGLKVSCAQSISGDCLTLNFAGSNSEDSDSVPGWSIANGGLILGIIYLGR